MSTIPRVQLEVDGRQVEVADEGASLLDALRGPLGMHAVKDGCSPQGQCGCCTVLVDGAPRVACVTPLRRVADKSITTVDGLDPAERAAWGDAFCAAGASQCGFCTPGIIVRLSGLRAKLGDTVAEVRGGDSPVDRALAAHLCRCTGWQTIGEAWDRFGDDHDQGRDLVAAGQRATIEGGTDQAVSAVVPLGDGGFADDTAPDDALVAVTDGEGGWSVAESLAAARAAAGKVQGRRTTLAVTHPLAVPPGDWARTLRTTWVEPAYLETDASWCAPGGEPASPLGNGGAFGAKVASEVGAAARKLADRHGRPVRVLLSREDTVRVGAKRPPIAAGLRADGTGVMRVVATPGIAAAVSAAAPGLDVEEVTVPGPPTSAAIRAAGWAEALVLRAALGAEAGVPVDIEAPNGARASAAVRDGRVVVRVACGDPLDEVVLRSYCIGAAHMAAGWVSSEALAVGEDGEPGDLTIRSFGILRPGDTPPIDVEIVPEDGPPVNGSDAVFAAVAAAVWVDQGCAATWPTGVAVASPP